MKRSASFPEWFLEWKQLGFIRPETAQLWRDENFTATGAAPWYHLDGVTPAEANTWKSLRFGPGDFVRWTSIGVTKPQEVVEWIQQKIGFETARAWIASGLTKPDLVRRCIGEGITPKNWAQCSARASLKRCFEWLVFSEISESMDAGPREKWMNNGVAPSVAQGWFELGINYSQYVLLASRGFDMSTFKSLDRDNTEDFVSIALQCESAEDFLFLIDVFEVDDFEKVIESKIPFDDLREWVRIEGVGISQIITLMKNGLSVVEVSKWTMETQEDFSFLIEMTSQGFSTEDAIKWAKRSLLTFQILKIAPVVNLETFDSLISLGFTVAQIIDLLKRPKAVQEVEAMLRSGWGESEQSSLLAHGVPRGQIPGWCLQVSGNFDVARGWTERKITLSQFEELQRVSNRSIRPADVDKWKEDGLSVADAIAMIRSKKDPFLVPNPMLANFRFPVVPTKSYLSGPKIEDLIQKKPVPSIGWIEKHISLASEEWYEEIFSIAHYLQGQFQKGISYSHTFENEQEGYSVEIHMVGDRVQTTISDLVGDIEKFQFDPGRLEQISVVSNSRQRLAAGLGLSWFLDWSIVWRGEETHTGSISHPYRKATGSSRFNSKAKYRYVGIDNSRSTAHRLPRGSHAAPVFHQVVGFVRTLADGYFASSEAQLRAPTYIRKELRPDQTWVRPHARGSGAGELVIRLKETSVLALALHRL